jgi:hypothetical protein
MAKSRCLPKLEASEKHVNSRVGFEGQTFPPQGWELHFPPGNVCRPDEAAALTGSRGLKVIKGLPQNSI